MSLLILCFTLILFLPTNAEYFINPTSSGYSPDGTRDNPYKSLDEALQSLGSGTYELVLLGDEYSLQASIIIPEDSQYTIRPDKIPSKNDYFLLKLEPGSNITVYQADLVLKDIQIVELDKDQPYEESTFFVTYGNLTLNNVRVSDIVYLDWGYTFILIEGDGTAKSQLNILNSAFENIINAEIAVISAKLTIKNSTFTGLQQIDGPLIFLYGNNASELDTNMIDIVLTNSSFEYSRDSTPTNFLSFYSCTVDVKIENLVAKDLMITNGSPLIEYISDFENSNSPTSFEVNNVKFENIYEKLNNVNGIQGTGNGLIFDIFGTTNLMMFNVSVSSVILQYASMLAYNPNTDNFLNKEILFPSATIKGFIIENSCGTNLLFSILDTVTLEDIHLKDNFLNTTDIDFAMFALMNVTKSYVRNFRSTNHSGPIIKMYEVLNQEFYDCIFEGTTTSHDLTTTFQNIISISRTKEFGLVYYPEDNVLTIFQNVVINGYDDIDPMNMTQESNDTYAIIVRSDIGKVYIRDSRFYNLKMGGFLSTAITYLEIDNFIADSDPSIPSEQISWHRLFQFVNIGQLIVKNSAFLNNKNINLFNLFNIRRDEIYDTIEYTQLDFSNITVINNQIDSSDPNDRYSSLIVVSSPLKSVQVTLSDSYFKDNIITSGIILFEESYVVDLYLENNRFDSNLAREYGAVFTARDMQDEYSTVQFQRNIFTNNTCLQKGGIFAFIATKHQITADNNSYIGNSAGISGGVGYILKSRAYYIESNGYYYNNSAGVYGGAWYFSVARSEGVAVSIHFENTTFDTLVTNQKGGALYIVTGSLNLRNSVFKQNKALIAGGDIYLIALSTLNISQVTFTGSYAAQGPLLYAETIYDETINIDNCMITDISSDHADTALIQTNAGSFKVTNTVFAKISSSLFMLEGTSIEFSNVLLNEITCSNTSTFCVLRGNFINLTLSNSNISQVISESDLIVLNFPSKKVIVDEVYVSDVMLPTEKKINGSQLFALKVFLAEDISLFDSSFDNLTDFSCIRAERSHLSISNSRFSNMRKDNDSLSEKAQFLVLDTSNVTIQSTLFEGNQAVNDQINGGAIQIMGSGGDYNIQDSIFKKNSAFEGGAISVEGSVDSFDLYNCLFEDNTAISMGGGIYFVPEVIENKALIKDCLFEENEANKGGAIHLKNEDMSIHGSTFRRNSANDGPAISFTEAKNNNPFEEGNTFEDN